MSTSLASARLSRLAGVSWRSGGTPTNASAAAALRRSARSARRWRPARSPSSPARRSPPSPSMTFSRQERSGTSDGFWNVRLTPVRGAREDGATGSPSTVMCPVDLGSSPLMQLSRVVLPAPFGPTKACTPPCPIGEVDTVERADAAKVDHESPYVEGVAAVSALFGARGLLGVRVLPGRSRAAERVLARTLGAGAAHGGATQARPAPHRPRGCLDQPEQAVTEEDQDTQQQSGEEDLLVGLGDLEVVRASA